MFWFVLRCYLVEVRLVSEMHTEEMRRCCLCTTRVVLIPWLFDHGLTREVVLQMIIRAFWCVLMHVQYRYFHRNNPIDSVLAQPSRSLAYPCSMLLQRIANDYGKFTNLGGADTCGQLHHTQAVGNASLGLHLLLEEKPLLYHLPFLA